MKKITLLILPFLLIGFMVSCKNDKSKSNTSGAAKAAVKSGKSYTIDSSLSKVIWTGSKPTGSHTGTLNVSSGNVSFDDGKLTGGKFVLDMNSINNTDLEGDSKADLEAHLKGTEAGKEDHFFNVAKYPTAQFEITKVTALEGNADANCMVYGNLTLKDVTKQVGFRAKTTVSGNSLSVSTPKFAINRTEWGIQFMSKSFVDDIKDKFINDDIELQINIRAKA